MDIITPPIVKRFVGFQRYEPRHIDSSAQKELKRCPRAFFLRYVLGFTSRDTAIYFAFGTAYHKFREVTEKAYAKATKPIQSYELLIAEGIIAGIKSWGVTQDPPPNGDYYWLNKNRLILTMQTAGRHWKREKEIGKIEVLETEQPFNIELPNGVSRSGRFDNIIKFNGKVWGRDFKSTTQEMKWFERGLQPNDQFLGYTVAQRLLTGEKVRGQLVEVVSNPRPAKKDGDTLKDPVIETKTVEYTDSQIEEWMEGQIYWEKIRDMYREADYYPQNEGACFRCIFHSVCRLSSEPQQMLHLKSNYKVEVWDNTYED